MMLAVTACGGGLSEAEYLARAEAAKTQGDYTATIIDLKNVLQENPANAQGRYLLGETYLEIGDYLAAEKELFEAQNLGVSADSVLPLLSYAFLRSGQLEKLEALDINSVAEDQGRAEILADKGVGALISADINKAALYTEAALGLAPDNLRVIVTNARVADTRLEEDYALTELDRAFAIDPNYAPAWSLLGDLQYGQQDLVAAVDSYSKAIANSILHSDELLRRTQLQISLQRYDEAQKDLNKLKSMYPKASNVNYLQGVILRQKGSLPEARDAFEASVLSNNKNALALYNLASVQYTLGELQQAQSHVNQYLSVVPNSSNGLLLSAQIHLQQGDFNSARKALTQLLEDSTYSQTAKGLLAGVELRSGNAGKAANLLAELVSSMPESATLRVQFAIALIQSGQVAAGIDELEAGLQIDPTLEAAHTTLIRTQVAQQSPDEAKVAATNYLERFPSNPDALTLAGEVYQYSGNQARAVELFEAAIKQDPSHPQANHNLASYAADNKDYAAARSRLEAVLKGNKDHLKTLINLAALEATVGDKAAYELRLQQASAAHPDQPQPQLILARYYLASAQASRVPGLMLQLDNATQNSPAVLEVLALASLAQNNFEDARFQLDRLLDSTEPRARGYYLMALTQAGLNNAEKMEANLKRAINLNPTMTESWLALASYQVSSGQHAAAKESVQELKTLGANRDRILRLEAALAAGGRDYQQQEELLGQLSSEAVTGKDVLDMANARLQSGDTAGAIELQREWVDENKGDYVSALALAKSLIASGDTAGAVAVYESSLEENANNFLVLNEIAWVLKETEPKRALQYSKRAAELSGEVPAVLDTYAMVLAANNQLELARRTIDQVLDKANRPAFRYHSALIYLQQNKKDAAIEELSKLLEAGSVFEQRQAAVDLLASLQ